MQSDEEALALSNPHLVKALETEKRESHRLAIITRTVVLAIVALVLPILNPNPSVLMYEFFVLVFILLGWLQLRVAKVGRSRTELALIMADIILMTITMTLPNPLNVEPFPAPYVYQFGTFIYLFIILSVATLAYSWRTVWSIGIMTTLVWLLGALCLMMFGRVVPEMTTAIADALPDFPIVASELNPNNVRWPLRFQEVIVFVLVAGVLAVKGWRSNQLLIKQAQIANERANLSRYFPASLVDTLASTDHDIGAVRNQEIAVMFSDIVGFTKIAETMEPEQVMALLREYHALVERAIFQNEGTLDKYLGDGVMATFGTPIPGDNDALNALNAARQIVIESHKLNREREARGDVPFKISVGLHYGPAILGDIGPERRLEFAVVGDSVNVASRIEAATRDLDCHCAVSDDLMCKISASNVQMPEGFVKHKDVRLKGRSTPIDLWADNYTA